MKRLKVATARPLDIWQSTVTPWNPLTGERDEAHVSRQVMFNYFNMGFNPQAAYGFHSLRRHHPELFKTRLINKCWYVYYGIGSLITGSTNLKEAVSVSVDGESVALPNDLRTLILLNFTSYQAGLDIWGPPLPDVRELALSLLSVSSSVFPEPSQDPRKPKMDDKLLEVVGLGGPTHETLVRLYLTAGMRIAQGGRVQIKVNKPGISIAMAVRVSAEALYHPAPLAHSLAARRRALLAGAVRRGRRSVGPGRGPAEPGLAGAGLERLLSYYRGGGIYNRMSVHSSSGSTKASSSSSPATEAPSLIERSSISSSSLMASGSSSSSSSFAATGAGGASPMSTMALRDASTCEIFL